MNLLLLCLLCFQVLFKLSIRSAFIFLAVAGLNYLVFFDFLSRNPFLLFFIFFSYGCLSDVLVGFVVFVFTCVSLVPPSNALTIVFVVVFMMQQLKK